jgi:hypothetical protein
MDEPGCGPPGITTGNKDPFHKACVKHDKDYDNALLEGGDQYSQELLKQADKTFLNNLWALSRHSVLKRLRALLYITAATPWRLLRNKFK